MMTTPDTMCICGHRLAEHEGRDWCDARNCPCQRFEDQAQYRIEEDDEEDMDLFADAEL